MMTPTSPEIVELYRMVAVWGIGVIGTLIGVIVALFSGRFKKIAALVDRTVMKDEFDKRLLEHDVEQERRHNENSKKLDGIFETTKAIAAQAVELGRLGVRIEILEKREAYMADWKHETVDPYLPNEMINLERRVSVLEIDMREMRSLQNRVHNG